MVAFNVPMWAFANDSEPVVGENAAEYWENAPEVTEIVAYFSYNEYEGLVANREKSNAELFLAGYSSSEVSFIRSSAPEERLLELGRMSDEELTSMGYSRTQIDLLREYDGSELTMDSAVLAATATLSGSIGKVSASANGAVFRYSWSWSSQPQLLTDGVIMSWTVYDGQNNAKGSTISHCAGVVGYTIGGNTYYSSSQITKYENADSVGFQFPMSKNGYAKVGNLDVHIAEETGTLARVDVDGTYYHQYSEASWGFTFGWPSVTRLDVMTTYGATGVIRP